MREDFLHYIWKYRKLPTSQLRTTKKEALVIWETGQHNRGSGPDFFNAKLEIDHQIWAGNVEMHLRSSDWYVHRHEKDREYDNVVLHVVWDHDIAVFRRDNSEIPCLELQTCISGEFLETYEKLFYNRQAKFISCEKDIVSVRKIIWNNWLERLYFERLQRKADLILTLLKESANDWEAVFFRLLLKNFGLKANGESFFSLAKALDFSVIRKLSSNHQELEAVFYGMTGLLEQKEPLDSYQQDLKKDYRYAKKKFGLREKGVFKPAFFQLRPPNFPTIRLSQFASLYCINSQLFSQILEASTCEEIYCLFDIAASVYWDTHYTFGKSSGNFPKKLSRNFIDLLIINTIIPVKFGYMRFYGQRPEEGVLSMIWEIQKENNSIVKAYESCGMNPASAMESQSLLELYNNYCAKNHCLQCAVGNQLLEGK